MDQERKTNCGRELTCILCEHFFFDGGCEGYSEVTPASPMGANCGKNLWPWLNAPNLVEFRQTMLAAQDCKDFQRYSEED